MNTMVNTLPETHTAIPQALLDTMRKVALNKEAAKIGYKLVKITAPHPHKSTTHEEQFFHVKETPMFPKAPGTVFFRKEDDGRWYGSCAILSNKCKFSRKGGRTNSRRRYFLGKRCEVPEPTYAQAQMLVEDAWEKRQIHRYGMERWNRIKYGQFS